MLGGRWHSFSVICPLASRIKYLEPSAKVSARKGKFCIAYIFLKISIKREKKIKP